MTRSSIGAFVCLVATSPAASAGDVPPHVSVAESAITVDARLDESTWDGATTILLTHETSPGENTPARARTECLVTHDREHLYVAFRAEEPEPGSVRARYRDRDTAWDDDRVGIVLDTFDDHRRAFEFWSNPLGVQIDVFNDEINGTQSDAWDAIWTSAGRLTETGYVVEMAIPFSQIPFPRHDGTMRWGFDAIRYRPRDFVQRSASNPLDRDNDCYLCQLDRIEGFAGISAGRNLEVVPTLTGGRIDESENPGEPLVEGHERSDLGLTVSWGLTPNLSLDATINPDFSQVEADAGRLDINQQFTLFFPERRPFFLEGADVFDSPLDVIFTRNVASPSWGAKITGKEGRHSLGAFVAQDEVTNLIFPGSQGSSSASLDFETTDAVGRYRIDVGPSSSLGALVTSRSGGEYANHVAGLDGLVRFGSADSVSFQLLGSQTRYPDELALEKEQPLGELDDVAASVRYRHDARDWFWQLRGEDVGRDFRADMGFMPRVDYQMVNGTGQKIWWGDDGAKLQRIRLGLDYERWEDHDGVLLEDEWDLFVTLDGPKDSFLWIGPRFRERTFEGVRFEETDFIWYVEAQLNRGVYLSLWGLVGDDIDFANVQPADAVTLEPTLRLDLGRHLQAHLSHAYRTLDVDNGRLFEANLSRLRLIYQFNRRTFVRLVLENTDVVRDPSLYRDEVDARTRDLFGQLLFSYTVNPRTVAFVGYSDAYAADELVPLTQVSRSVFLKLSYSWRP